MECLVHPIFDDIRSEEIEQSANHKIKLPVDADGTFDYETGKNLKFDKEALMK